MTDGTTKGQGPGRGPRWFIDVTNPREVGRGSGSSESADGLHLPSNRPPRSCRSAVQPQQLLASRASSCTSLLRAGLGFRDCHGSKRLSGCADGRPRAVVNGEGIAWGGPPTDGGTPWRPASADLPDRACEARGRRLRRAGRSEGRRAPRRGQAHGRNGCLDLRGRSIRYSSAALHLEGERHGVRLLTTSPSGVARGRWPPPPAKASGPRARGRRGDLCTVLLRQDQRASHARSRRGGRRSRRLELLATGRGLAYARMLVRTARWSGATPGRSRPR